MNENQSLGLISQVVEQYKGTAEEHRLLAQAVSVIAQLVKKEGVKKEVKTDK